MTIGEYINSLEFETVKFYQKKRNLNSIRVFGNGQNQYFEEFSNQASYIIDIEEFEEVMSSNESSKLKSRFKESMHEYQTSSRHHEILSVIQFYKNGLVQGQLNCNFLRSQFMTIENEPLNYSTDNIANIYSWAKEDGYQIMPYRPAGNQQNVWNHFFYPNSFYLNSNFNVFETAIDINLNSINSKLWRLHIPKIDDRPTTEQLNATKKFYDKRWEIRKLILDSLYLFYQGTARYDFELPKLDNQEQIFYFINKGTLSLIEGTDEVFSIEFGTWDEEHGAHYHYFLKDHRLQQK